MTADAFLIRRRVWLVGKLAIGVCVIATIVYFTKFAPVDVTTYKVQREVVVAEVMGTGTLEARVATSIGPKISGRILETLADQGQHVKAGDLLVRLDGEELIQQVEIAGANLAARKAAIERLRADKQRNAAIQSQAVREFERLSKLSSAQAVSLSDFDKAREALAIAEAGLGHSEAAMAEAQEEFVAAEKTFEYQQTLLSNTRITAPFDGLIVDRTGEPGDVVVPGSSILRLISTVELWVNAWVDETEIGRLADGQTARVLFRSEPDRSYSGKVARLGRQADRETREFVVDVSVLELPMNWAVGQRADVFIEVARHEATLAVPAKAIVWRDGEAIDPSQRVAGVWTAAGGRAEWRAVTVGLRNREMIEVLSGIALGESVVVPTGSSPPMISGTRIRTP